MSGRAVRRFHRPARLGVRALLIALVILAASCAGPRAPSPTPVVPRPHPEGITWQGGTWFLLGVNYPWHQYGNDFGNNARGSFGVHNESTYRAVDADFAKMARMGVHTVRWFVFGDGSVGITYDRHGMPTGIDQNVLPDMDAALEIAQRHNIYLDLVLLDFLFMKDAEWKDGVQSGGHANVINSDQGQKALVNKVFKPLFQRYGQNPYILSWEVMNEPEWTVSDFGKVHGQFSHPSTLDNFRRFTRRVVDAVHSETGSYATLGSASLQWVSSWTGLDLDYYQAHYYDWMRSSQSDNLFHAEGDQLGLDRPLVVGEFPAAYSRTAGLKHYLDTWYANGFAGAWPWSFKKVDGQGTPDGGTFSSWAADHSESVSIPAADQGARNSGIAPLSVPEAWVPKPGGTGIIEERLARDKPR